MWKRDLFKVILEELSINPNDIHGIPEICALLYVEEGDPLYYFKWVMFCYLVMLVDANR